MSDTPPATTASSTTGGSVTPTSSVSTSFTRSSFETRASAATPSGSSTATPGTSDRRQPRGSSKSANSSHQESQEEKIVNRYTGLLVSDGLQKKMYSTDHKKRLEQLRKIANDTEKTDWQYEPIEKLLGQ